MKLSRREFMTLAGGSTVGAVIFTACGVPADELLVEAPLDLPEDLVNGIDSWFATTDDSGLGVIVRVMEGRAKKIAGNPDYPVNLGKHAVHADTALQTLYHPDRVDAPMRRRAKGQPAVRISWDEANSLLSDWMSDSEGSLSIVTNPIRGGDAKIAGDVASAFSGKLMYFDPLEQGVLHEAIKTVFNQDRIPEFDIANADTVLSFGADWLGTWLSPVRYSTKYGDFRGGEHRGFMMHAESRMSMTAAAADQWLTVNPGYEGDLAMSMASVIVEDSLVDAANITAYTANIPDGELEKYAPALVAERVGISADIIHDAAHRFAESSHPIAFGGGSAGAQTNGVFNLTAIYALNILVGSVGSEGGIMFNPAGAMGLPDSATGASFEAWEKELAQWRAGNVKTVITRGVDLVHGLPRSVDAGGALDEVENVVAFTGVLDSSSEHANLILPENSYLENWGLDVPEPAPGYEVVGFRQPVVNAPLDGDTRNRLYDSRNFLDTLIQAAGSRVSVNSVKDFVNDTVSDIYAAGRGSVSATDERLFMNGVLQRGGWWDVDATATTNAPSSIPSPLAKAAGPGLSELDEHVEGHVFTIVPFAHQSILDGRNAASPWAQATPDPITTVAWTTWAEINFDRAKELGIGEGTWITVRTTTGEIKVQAYPHPGISPDVIAIPIGQGRHEEIGGRYAEDRGENILNILVDKKESETGALAWGATRATVSKSGGKKEFPKFEGDAKDIIRPAEHGVPILIVEPGQSAHDAQERNHELHLKFISNDE
ncbi:MAG: molybdopterin-dependent oxidoreductase [Chloroflexi bacterium]|jgi:menaquinone reductase, molybdopterin-binding-like subunit|nr:molybdopterin-dependent oxidoreductase [Chloroflexota bacterium]MBT4515156.1 molybdopterin-dependent oxidoreductase [Chloroflexota bacterium]MBT5320070.1 molybdopterin-dependent oxidoreductase [Chloroflexota bacterium]MBT6683182.1 molybdopterin-dependent oxidoreductase [Chloroflexota bacterium]